MYSIKFFYFPRISSHESLMLFKLLLFVNCPCSFLEVDDFSCILTFTPGSFFHLFKKI